MKKIKKVLSILVLCLILITTSACLFTKDVLNDKEFTDIMTNKKFKVTDVTDQYNSYDYISSVQVAVAENNEFQVEFYQLNNVDNAKKIYESNKLEFSEEKSSSSFTSDINMGNFNAFSLSDATSYRYICRVDDTVIYVNTTKENQKEVKNIIEILGY